MLRSRISLAVAGVLGALLIAVVGAVLLAEPDNARAGGDYPPFTMVRRFSASDGSFEVYRFTYQDAEHWRYEMLDSSARHDGRRDSTGGHWKELRGDQLVVPNPDGTEHRVDVGGPGRHVPGWWFIGPTSVATRAEHAGAVVTTEPSPEGERITSTRMLSCSESPYWGIECAPDASTFEVVERWTFHQTGIPLDYEEWVDGALVAWHEVLSLEIDE